MISISHAPNSDALQQKLARSFYLPWRWKDWQTGPATQALETWFTQRFAPKGAVAFSSGREALSALLSAAGIGQGDEVIIQAYTCIVVPNAVLWSGAKPVYVDIDSSLNIDAANIEAAMTPATKAVIVQHTFGVPANMPAIREICTKRRVLLIEDCAHALGATIAGKEVGTWGDAAMFSFGRDKIISGVSGGMAIAFRQDLAERLRAIERQAPRRRRAWIAQNLMHPILMPMFTRWLERGKLGAVGIRFAQALRLLNKVYTPGERESQKPAQTRHRLPNAMAELALQQLEQRLTVFSKHRRALATQYEAWASQRGLPHQTAPAGSSPAWLRFTILCDHPFRLITQARKQGFVLGDWYSHVIMPRPADDERLNYRPGSCPNAEQAAKTSLNLPTHMHMTNERAEALLNWLESEV